MVITTVFTILEMHNRHYSSVWPTCLFVALVVVFSVRGFVLWLDLGMGRSFKTTRTESKTTSLSLQPAKAERKQCRW